VGPGGLLVDFDAPVDDWTRALSTLWDDPATYARYAEAARMHSQRDDMRPQHLAQRFEEEMRELIAGAG
jgi:hypothetical protein